MSEKKFSHLNDIESTKGEIDLPTEADYSPTPPVNNTLQKEKEDQDDMWREIMNDINDWNNGMKGMIAFPEQLKSKYHITRK